MLYLLWLLGLLQLVLCCVKIEKFVTSLGNEVEGVLKQSEESLQWREDMIVHKGTLEERKDERRDRKRKGEVGRERCKERERKGGGEERGKKGQKEKEREVGRERCKERERKGGETANYTCTCIW